jgi:hypothetical protein
MQFLTEGFYVGTSKDPTARALQTWLQPSNYLLYAPLIGFKSQDIVNLVTGGRFLSPLVETGAREGAAAYALKMGAKDEEAAMKYWTSSGQFNEHPLSANLRGMIRPMMFFNPMVQGMRNFAQVLTDPDPAVRGRMAARLIQVAAMSSVGAGATYMWMSDEDKERERERPIEERMGYANVGGFRLAFAYGPCRGTRSSRPKPSCAAQSRCSCRHLIREVVVQTDLFDNTLFCFDRRHRFFAAFKQLGEDDG